MTDPQNERVFYTCPTCGLACNRPKVTEVDDITYWRCWDCTYIYGVEGQQGFMPNWSKPWRKR